MCQVFQVIEMACLTFWEPFNVKSGILKQYSSQNGKIVFKNILIEIFVSIQKLSL